MAGARTFEKLATVDLAGCDLERDYVALIVVSDARWARGGDRHTAASLRSLIGIPIVLVILLIL
jgi:hypothetical protein